MMYVGAAAAIVADAADCEVNVSTGPTAVVVWAPADD